MIICFTYILKRGFRIIIYDLYFQTWCKRKLHVFMIIFHEITIDTGERGGSVVECRTPEREVRGSRPTSAVLCPWARHFTPRKYWLITQEAMAPSRHDWKIVDWDVKPQHNQPTNNRHCHITDILTPTFLCEDCYSEEYFSICHNCRSWSQLLKILPVEKYGP